MARSTAIAKATNWKALFIVLAVSIVRPQLSHVTIITRLVERTMYTAYSLIMGRLSKVVLLSLLLVLSGVPGTASLLCAQSMKAHACCMGHDMANDPHCGASSVRPGSPCCCKMTPVNSAPAQNL